MLVLPMEIRHNPAVRFASGADMRGRAITGCLLVGPLLQGATYAAAFAEDRIHILAQERQVAVQRPRI